MKRFVIGMIIALCVSVSGSLSCFAYENAVYTENELKIAKERLSENREVLDITSIATDLGNNSLVVTSEFWNETKKQEVIKIAGITNIRFEIYDGNEMEYGINIFKFKLGEDDIYFDDRTLKMENQAFSKNGIYMIPINSLLNAIGCDTNIDTDAEKLSASVNNMNLIIDKNGMSTENYENKFLIEPMILESEFYIAYNDLKDFIRLSEKADGIWFTGEIYENMLWTEAKETEKRNIYFFRNNSGEFLLNGVRKDMDGRVYFNSVEDAVIPLRTMAVMMDDDPIVTWDDVNKTAIVKVNYKTFKFMPNSDKMTVNSEETSLPRHIITKEDYLYVPVKDLPMIQYYLGNKMDMYDIYIGDSETMIIRC